MRHRSTVLALAVALALTQTPPEPSRPPDAPVASSRRAGLFTSPPVTAGRLVGRVGMGLVLGSLVGGALSGGAIIVGGTLAASGVVSAMVLATPLAIITLGMGTALGAALFGEDFGRDLLDAMLVANACAVLSVAAVVTLFYLAPATVGLMVAVVAGLIFPAVATPLVVQAFKPGDPQPTVALAAF